jgi:hypothetical protein
LGQRQLKVGPDTTRHHVHLLGAAKESTVSAFAK